MAHWFSRWMRSDGARKRPGARGRQQAAGKNARRRARSDRRHPPAPLTWNNPDQDFITRYGDPFDG